MLFRRVLVGDFRKGRGSSNLVPTKRLQCFSDMCVEEGMHVLRFDDGVLSYLISGI